MRLLITDADNQYYAGDIPALVAPTLEGRADIVVGARPIDAIKHFSLAKKFLQKLGSWVVRSVSRTDVPDAASGLHLSRIFLRANRKLLEDVRFRIGKMDVPLRDKASE